MSSLPTQQAFWRSVVADIEPLALRTDRPPGKDAINRPERIALRLAPELSSELQRLAAQEAVDSASIMLAAYGTLLGLFNAQTDFCIGAGAATAIVPVRFRLAAQKRWRDVLNDIFETRAHIAVSPAASFDVDALLSSASAQDIRRVSFDCVQRADLTQRARGADGLDLRLVVAHHGDRVEGTWLFNGALFHRQTIEQLSLAYQRLLEQVAAAPQQELARLVIAPLHESACDNASLPCSAAQLAIWRHLKAQPDRSRYYDISTYVELDGPIDRTALLAALENVVARTAALRLCIIETSMGIRQRVVDALPFEMTFVDCSQDPDSGSAARQWMARERLTTFDLACPPLFRFALIKVADDRHYWFSHYHHLLLDGVGQQLVNQRTALAYSAATARAAVPLADDSQHYVGYLAADISYNYSWKHLEDLRYWRTTVADDSPVSLCVHSAAPSAIHGALESHSYRLSEQVVGAINEHAKRSATPLQHFMIAALVGYLFRVTAKRTLSIGLPTHGRLHGPLRQLVAVCTNVLPLQFEIEAQWSLAQLVAHVKERMLGTMTHRRFRGEQIRHAREARLTGRLFNVVVNVLPFPEQLAFGAAAGWPRSLTPGYVDDLTIWIFTGHNGAQVTLKIDGNPARYTRWELDCHAQAIETWLKGVTANINCAMKQLPLCKGGLPDGAYGGPVTAHSELSVQRLFEMQCDLSPDAIAIKCRNQQLSYRQLDQRANQVAHCLMAHGVRPESLIGVYLDRSIEMIVALLGIMKAGAAWLPLDTSYPAKRLELLLRDAQPPVMLTRKHLADESLLDHSALIYLDEHSLAAFPSCRSLQAVTKNSLAYCIYTSGSSGAPKGVLVEHGSLTNHCLSMLRLFELTPADRVLQFSSISFDASIEEIFPTLVAGATLVLQPERVMTSARFLELLAAQEISVVNLPVAYWGRLTADLSTHCVRPSPAVRLVVVGGEKLTSESFRRWQSLQLPRIKLLNTYGPTEATVSCTAYDAQGDCELSSVPIGKPIDNVFIYILDEQLNPLPVGLPGEIHIGGGCVARGYLHQDALTAERFIADPLRAGHDARMYKSGDTGRYLPDGNIEFLWRTDQQVKINGHRVQLEEIEAVLHSHPMVHKAAVAMTASGGVRRLVGYVVLSQQAQRTDLAALRRHLRQYLPEYMVPSQVVVLDELPLTVTGKLNRAALPAPTADDVVRAKFEEPATGLQRSIAQAWCEVLNVARISIHDNFYDLGGSSLLALEARMALEERLGRELLPGLFEGVTLAEIALQVDAPTGGPTYEEQMQLLALDPQ